MRTHRRAQRPSLSSWSDSRPARRRPSPAARFRRSPSAAGTEAETPPPERALGRAPAAERLRLYRPLYFGSRFSANALTASRKSSLAMVPLLELEREGKHQVRDHLHVLIHRDLGGRDRQRWPAASRSASSSARSISASSSTTKLTSPSRSASCGGDPVTGHQIVLGSVDPHQQRPDQLPSIARGDSHSHVGVGEDGAAGREDDIAQQGDGGAEPHRVPVHGGEDRFPAVEEVVHEPSGLQPELSPAWSEAAGRSRRPRRRRHPRR